MKLFSFKKINGFKKSNIVYFSDTMDKNLNVFVISSILIYNFYKKFLKDSKINFSSSLIIYDF